MRLNGSSSCCSTATARLTSGHIHSSGISRSIPRQPPKRGQKNQTVTRHAASEASATQTGRGKRSIRARTPGRASAAIAGSLTAGGTLASVAAPRA